MIKSSKFTSWYIFTRYHRSLFHCVKLKITFFLSSTKADFIVVKQAIKNLDNFFNFWHIPNSFYPINQPNYLVTVKTLLHLQKTSNSIHKQKRLRYMDTGFRIKSNKHWLWFSLSSFQKMRTNTFWKTISFKIFLDFYRLIWIIFAGQF